MARIPAQAWKLVATLFALACVPVLAGQAATPPPEQYTPGVGGAVASWTTQDYDQLKNSTQAICLYVYLPTKGVFPEAKFIENDFLSNAEVAAKLKNWRCVKIDAAKINTMKHWPKDLLQRAKTGRFTVMLLSSDLVQQSSFTRAEADPKRFVASIDATAKYQEKVKAAIEKRQEMEREKERKQNGEQQADAGKRIEVPGLNTKKDEENKDKKDPPKPVEPKRPSGPADE